MAEPYVTAFEYKDSAKFRNLSRSIDSAIDELYEDVYGEQKSHVVGIVLEDYFNFKFNTDAKNI